MADHIYGIWIYPGQLSETILFPLSMGREQPIEADMLLTAITTLEVVVKQWILEWYLGSSKKENKWPSWCGLVGCTIIL